MLQATTRSLQNTLTHHSASRLMHPSKCNKVSRVDSYLPLRLGVKPISKHKDTDMRREATTVTTALSAKPHLDFTISILPERTGKPQ